MVTSPLAASLLSSSSLSPNTSAMEVLKRLHAVIGSDGIYAVPTLLCVGMVPVSLRQVLCWLSSFWGYRALNQN